MTNRMPPERQASTLSRVTLALVALLCAAAPASFAACSKSDAGASAAAGGGNGPDAGPAMMSSSIGAKGGKVTLPDGASLLVQPGGLSGNTMVTIATVDPPVPPPAAGLSPVFAFTPHGVKFQVPAKIAIPYTSSLPAAQLSVMRLASPTATKWQIVGGVTFSGGVASFDTTSLSYYVVVPGECASGDTTDAGPCLSCTCCGTCPMGDYCKNAATCTSVGQASVCDNPSLYVVEGTLPDLTMVDAGTLTDTPSASAIANAIVTRCGATGAGGPLMLTTVSQAAPGILEPCTDAPLLCGGTTIVLAGGSYTQRLAAAFDRNKLAPISLVPGVPTAAQDSFVNTAGTTVSSFDPNSVSPTHDYFVIAAIADPDRGALVLNVWGVGWQGTPAASWYLQHSLLDGLADGSHSIGPVADGGTAPTWQRYLLVEWTAAETPPVYANDTFTILAKDQ